MTEEIRGIDQVIESDIPRFAKRMLYIALVFVVIPIGVTTRESLRFLQKIYYRIKEDYQDCKPLWKGYK